MSGRARLAIGVLAAWVVTLGWHVKRTYFRPVTELVAEAAATLPPGTAYYAVRRGERHVGWAQSHVDTLPGSTGFVLEDRLVAEIDLPAGGEAELRLESRTELGPTLTLRTFDVRSRGLLGAFRLSGRVHGDSLLVVRRTVEGDSAPGPARLTLDGPVVPEAALPMRFVVWNEVRPGRTFRVPLLDPTTLTIRPVEVEVLERRVRTFPDSATTDAEGRWVEARRDTVDSWLLRRDVGGLALRTWVDEDGRLLEAQTAAGLRLERTAFELAYYGAADEAPEPGPATPPRGRPASPPEATREPAGGRPSSPPEAIREPGGRPSSPPGGGP